MSVTFKSFLSAVGHDFVSVFKWLGSSQGQATVTATETAAAAITTAVNPAAGAVLVGIEALINAALKQVVSIEAVSVAAAQQSGTGVQKASAVASAVAPQISSTLVSLGVANPTAAEVQNIAEIVATSLANIYNAFPAPVASVPQSVVPAA